MKEKIEQMMTLDVEMQIEELEPKLAPDGGETVLPLSTPRIQ